MPGDQHAGTPTYLVVVNDEEQYSLWDAAQPVPAGWRETGHSGTKDQCLAVIAEIWTDMRPRSLRERVAAEGEASGPGRSR